MCGFVGILSHKAEYISKHTLTAMTRMIAYRGPDGEGIYRNGSVGFGHRRLSIIDLSDAGSQPMLSQDGRYVLVYNGTIYNYRELRGELKHRGYAFSSQSDTEVLLNALIEWGTRAIPKLNGMFAFVLFDKNRQRILMARDRYGIKPLYIAETPKGYLIGSEIKSFLEHPDFTVRVNLEALNEYFTFQNMLGSRTLFEGVRVLPPGYFQAFQKNSGTEAWDAQPPIQYWDFSFHSNGIRHDPKELADQLYSLLVQAVQRQTVSDVPIGSHLSGGIDSGSIVAIASREVDRLTTFTGGFDLSSAQGMEAGYDERAAAEVLSNQFKTEHYEMVLHAGDMAHALPRLVWHLEELRLGQCYPNYYLSRLASRFVKVVLCGTGGDELFAGYPWRYFGSANCSENGTFLRNYYHFWQRIVPDENKKQLFRDHVRNQIDPNASFDAFSRVLSSPKTKRNGIESNIDRSLYFEAKSFLHGLLMVEDKLAMAHGLESRVPLLDNDLVDFASEIPVRMKLRNIHDIPRIDENELGKNHRYQLKSSDGKYIFRQAIERVLPRAVTDRAKQGFSSPDVSWYRGESLDYVRDLLTTRSPCIYEYLEPKFVRRVIQDHMSGRRNHRLLIWSFLCFEWWLKIFLNGERPKPSVTVQRTNTL